MRAAIMIPIYKPRRADLTWYEKISLERCIEVLGRYPLVFVAPEGRTFDYLPTEIDYTVETFDERYFGSLYSYNALMLSPKFYERFSNYEYILIYQLDAFVFSDRLEEFCRLGYDYIGAPWPVGIGIKGTLYLSVGNGGFCLRRVQACIDLLKNHSDFLKSTQMPEDAIFSYLGRMNPDEFKVAPLRTASEFSFEILPERYYRKNGNKLPFGCHGYHRYGLNFYGRFFSECGYDLAPYEHLRKAHDLYYRDVAIDKLLDRRLLSRLREGHSLRYYLPSDEEFFVFLADRQSLELLNRLRAEGLKIINEDRIVIALDDKILNMVANILSRINRRGLLLSIKNDTPIAMKLIHAGFKYGGRFISLQQEFRRRQLAVLRRMLGATIG